MRRLIVAIVGQDVRVDLVQDVNGDAAVRRGHILIGLFEQRIERLQHQVFTQQLVRELVDAHKRVQLNYACQVARLEFLY